MKPSEIFDICHEFYLRLRLSSNKVSTINPMASCQYLWRPDRSPRVIDYMADFELLGRRVLGRHPMWRGRLRLFEFYFCDAMPYRVAIARLGVRPGTFDWWCREIKEAVGRELLRAGLFPPAHYFREPSLNHRKPTLQPVPENGNQTRGGNGKAVRSAQLARLSAILPEARLLACIMGQTRED